MASSLIKASSDAATEIMVGTMSHPGMLQGQWAFITKEDDKIRLDGAKVVGVDIACSNGVIHMIDTVLQPIEAAAKR